MTSPRQPIVNAWKLQPKRHYKRILYGQSYSLLRMFLLTTSYQITYTYVIPPSLLPQLLQDEPSVWRHCFDKFLRCLQQKTYWVGMARDMKNYCIEFLTRQRIKHSLPSKTPLVSLPIGQPWEMIAVDVLQVRTNKMIPPGTYFKTTLQIGLPPY